MTVGELIEHLKSEDPQGNRCALSRERELEVVVEPGRRWRRIVILTVLFDQSFAAAFPVVALPPGFFGAQLVIVGCDESHEGAQLFELDGGARHLDRDGVEAPASFLDVDQVAEALALAYLDLGDTDLSELGRVAFGVRDFVGRHRGIVADSRGFWWDGA